MLRATFLLNFAGVLCNAPNVGRRRPQRMRGCLPALLLPLRGVAPSPSNAGAFAYRLRRPARDQTQNGSLT
jgi:hypothetical protein